MGLRTDTVATWSSRGIILVVLVTCLIYLPTFSNGFTNWDDDAYVTGNRFVQRLTATNLLHHFTSFTSGNYHPLTLLVYSLEYHFVGPDPRVFHGVSLLFHLLNVLVVYYLAVGLGASPRASCIAALVFGIHPLHVESVAWVSELKDVLSAFFFLTAIAAYLRYCRETQRTAWYGLALGLFLLSLLSKPMGVSLPFVLLLCDFLRGRRLERKVLLEKTPFFLLALGFGALALLSQQDALRVDNGFLLGENILVACHGVLFYLAKAIVPLDLSALYLIPAKVNGKLPAAFSGAPILVLLLAALIAAYGRRSKTVVFASLWFLITLLPVLQLVPIGSAAAADRYFYLPSFGLCFAAGVGFCRLEKTVLHRYPRGRLLPLLAGATLLVFFSGISRERIRVWKDSFSLWNDVVAKDPGSFVGFGYRGMAHATAGAYEPAMADFQRSLDLGGDRFFSSEVYSSRGALLLERQYLLEALADFNRALAIDPGAVKALVNRGNLFDALGRPGDALNDYNHGLSLEPENTLLYYNRGLTYHRIGNAAQAVLDYDEALKRDPWLSPALVNRGISHAQLNQFEAAIADFTRASLLEPNSAVIYENRGRAYAAIGNLLLAEKDRNRARSLAAERTGRPKVPTP